ncbi:hypothetical protein I553_3655 [Mycobacterium xenopi 4042]|uniref:Uncharacterized protein n=1 Tax=Mycobacterium xenopi 4042 TaxID=1299334 RepID=X7ZZE3_MYCXE|nr:hypothetical protein I553_3655 [Mycobacterium xenopi 4042]
MRQAREIAGGVEPGHGSAGMFVDPLADAVAEAAHGIGPRSV